MVVLVREELFSRDRVVRAEQFAGPQGAVGHVRLDAEPGGEIFGLGVLVRVGTLEGRVVAVVSAEQADEALARWQSIAAGEQAAAIGCMDKAQKQVVLRLVLDTKELFRQ